jgi:transcriptional regulator with XRE-family HTH domain
VSEFEETVRAARQARGWTQRELSQRVGVSQRTVSAWELGTSEPDEDGKRRLATVLGLPFQLVNAAGTRRPRLGRRYAGRAQLAELPLDKLDPQEFEYFAASLLKELYPQAKPPYLLGKSGHKQHGFDVVAEQDGRVRVAVQCKRRARFGPAEVGQAVAAAEMQADEYLIFLSKVATPAAHAAMRQHEGWQLWDRKRLSQAVHGLQRGAAARIVDRYFPNLRYDFLGLMLPGPWLEAGDYYRRIARSEHYSHRWQLVGRSRVLDDLTAFTTGTGGKIGLLVGRGGLGKTRLLKAVCDRLSDEQDLAILFLDRDPDIDARSFELLPAGRLLVIIDDAHDDVVPLAKIITGVHAANPGADVLLALRPYGEPRVRLELRDAGIHSEDVFRGELGDLDITDAETLAREVLGDGPVRFATRLAYAVGDCPLLLVASAELVRRGKLSLDWLEGNAAVSRDLEDVLVGAVVDELTHSEVRAEVLHAVAALQPLRTADVEFRDALTALTGRSYDQVVPHLAALEEAGLLLRRGATFRVVPDLLGDWLLARKSYGPGGYTSTGYIDRVHRAAGGPARANLIVNAGRVEWQRRASVTGLLDGLWAALRDEFEVGSAETRRAVLEVLAKVAFFQPSRCLAVVRWALGHTLKCGYDNGDVAEGQVQATEGTRDGVCQILRGVAHHPEHLPEAAELLWQLASDDARPVADYEHHPMRILAQLAAFQPVGPTVYQHHLVDAVDQWLSRNSVSVWDPLEVLLPMLATEGHQEVWSPRAISFRPFALNPEAESIKTLRTKVLDLAFAQLSAPDPRRVLAALRTVGAALTPPIGGFGLEMTPEMRVLWDPEFTCILDRLERTIRQRPIADPVLCVELRSQIQWFAEYGTTNIRLACRSALSAIPSDMARNLARALHGGPVDPPHDPSALFDLQHRQRALNDLFADTISSLANLADREVVGEVEECLDDLEKLLGRDTSRAGPFVYELVTARPALAEAIADHVIANPDGKLGEQIAIVLNAVAAAGSASAVTVANKLLATNNTAIARHVAHAFGLQRGRIGQLLPGEADLLRILVVHDDSVVHAAAFGVLRTLGRQYKDLAIELLTCAPPERPGFAWWEIALAVGLPDSSFGTLEWSDLADDYKKRFFTVLRDVASIENYGLSLLLAKLSRDEPHWVVWLLTNRIERLEKGASARYVPLPHHWQSRLRFREQDAFLSILRDVCEWLAAAPESMWRRYYGSQLFNLIADGFDAPVRQVIDGYLQEPDSARMAALAVILNNIPASEISNLEFVRRCLRAASQCGPASLEAIQSALHHSVIAGQHGSPSQPIVQSTAQPTATQLASQCVSGSPEERFYRSVAASAEVWAKRQAEDWDILSDGRQW